MVHSSSERLRVLHVLLSIGETSAPYRSFRFPGALLIGATLLGAVVFTWTLVLTWSGAALAATTLVSVASDGTLANGRSDLPSLSQNGRFVTFESGASNLVPGDSGAHRDVFVSDTCRGAPAACVPSIVRISVAPDGNQGNGSSVKPSISADGRFVAFRSSARNLVAGTDNSTHVFLRDTCQGAPPGCAPLTIQVSIAPDGSQANNGGDEPAISADGRFVAFESLPTSFLAIFVRDTCQGAPLDCVPATTPVSVALDGSQAGGERPAINADGRFVAFESLANNLAPQDTNRIRDIFVRDTCQGVPAGCVPATTLVSVATDGSEANDRSEEAAISADGRFVAFASAAANLVPGDTNGLTDVFLRDTCQTAPPGCVPATTRVSVASDGSEANENSGQPTISADGRFVAFASFASNLVIGDTNIRQDVFLRDTCQTAPPACIPSTTRISVTSDGTQSTGRSDFPSISGDASLVAFRSFSRNLVPGDINDEFDIFLVDTGPLLDGGLAGLTLRVSTTGQTLRVRATLRPRPAGPVDAFVVFRVENVGFFSLQLNGQLIPGIVPIAQNFVPSVPFDAEIFTFPLTGNEPRGNHAVLGALTQTGTLNVVGSIDEKVFMLP
jgi:Tol biopolymer transport system component